MITLRLESDLEKDLTKSAEFLGISKSELVRRSIEAYLQSLEKPNAWELGNQFFGKYSSGKGDLSSNRKAHLKKKLKSKIK
ncbi:CopG family transcriptional regulator [bacterium]|jgi:RHH-type transcriptional regulator, rel operon repressor / antitoxin RelB|nr:CopG family transcriptional regulator [bacterium]